MSTMRLGSQTGSTTNYLLSGTNGQPAPEVGMGITLLHWTDRSAGTITRVSASGKTFWYKPDRAIRIDNNGMSEMQEYRYERQDDCTETRVSLRKNGSWVTVHGTRVRVGDRRAYHDYSF